MSNTSTSKDSGDVSLLQLLDISQSSCLNESSDHPLKSIIESKAKNTSSSFLMSDVDEQLLLNIAFNQVVRIRSIVIRSSESAKAPKHLKLTINRRALGFEDVEDATEPEVAQELDLSEEDVSSGKPVALRFVRFQSVNSLQIFISSNHGDEEETRIDAIDIIGIPVETTKDLSGLRQQEE